MLLLAVEGRWVHCGRKEAHDGRSEAAAEARPLLSAAKGVKKTSRALRSPQATTWPQGLAFRGTEYRALINLGKTKNMAVKKAAVYSNRSASYKNVTKR